MNAVMSNLADEVDEKHDILLHDIDNSSVVILTMMIPIFRFTPQSLSP